MQQSTAPDSMTAAPGPASPWGWLGHGVWLDMGGATGTSWPWGQLPALCSGCHQCTAPMSDHSTHSTHTVPSQGAWQTSAPHVPASGAEGHSLIAASSNQSHAALQCNGHRELNC